ncbi:hypothetical protein BGZ61DRAFT_529831 [Ilyonectria robusta]|uniref:uncharacterized protein n=1 Tax=Ilyonectria robusta TaxID=1079257 RepID=UPI001E8E0199|nr:uncharacterized protein BGZ61DRAFT_529831 [Ilyonectria robusta]KAH8729673.1 hypothetical protein BGZ61DRAFT_529831 [Ilyonectria robusta]
MSRLVSEAQALRHRLEPSKALQEKLLDAVATASVNIELLQTRGELSPDLMPGQAKKRQLNDGSDIDYLLAKKPRVTQTREQLTSGQPAEQMTIAQLLTEEFVSTTLQQPKSTAFNPQFSGIMKGFLNPVKPSLCPESVHAYISKWLESISIDADQDKWCQSDSQRSHSNDDSDSEELINPALYKHADLNTDGVAISPTSQLSCSPKDHMEAGSQRSSPVAVHASLPPELVAVDAPTTQTPMKLDNALYGKGVLGSTSMFMRSGGENFPDNKN